MSITPPSNAGELKYVSEELVNDNEEIVNGNETIVPADLSANGCEPAFPNGVPCRCPNCKSEVVVGDDDEDYDGIFEGMGFWIYNARTGEFTEYTNELEEIADNDPMLPQMNSISSSSNSTPVQSSELTEEEISDFFDQIDSIGSDKGKERETAGKDAGDVENVETPERKRVVILDDGERDVNDPFSSEKAFTFSKPEYSQLLKFARESMKAEEEAQKKKRDGYHTASDSDSWHEPLKADAPSSSTGDKAKDVGQATADQLSKQALADLLNDDGGCDDSFLTEDPSMVSHMREAFNRIFSWVSNGFKVARHEVETFVFDMVKHSVISRTTSSFLTFVKDHLDAFTAIIAKIFRFMHRLASGMPKQFLLSETLYDISELFALAFRLKADTIADMMIPNAAQPEWFMPLSAVFATILALFSAKPVDPFSFGYIWKSATSITGFIQGCVDGILSSSKYLFDYCPEKAFPRTLAFIEWIQKNGTGRQVSGYTRRKGAALYRGYLEERKEWTRTDLENYFKAKYPLLVGTDWSHLTASFPKTRMQPPCFVFQGKPGHGKTTIMHMLMAGLYICLRKLGKIPGDMPYDDFYYSWNTGLKHWDGYAEQPVTILNDFGKENETVNDTDAASTAFMNVVDSNPFFPSMASLFDKGTCFDAMCVFLSTMVPMNVWFNQFRKCSDTTAMTRRVTRCFDIKSRKFDRTVGEMVVDPDFAGDDQWIIQDSNTGDVYSIDQVIEFVCESVLNKMEKYNSMFDRHGMASIPTMIPVIERFVNRAKYADIRVPENQLPTLDELKHNNNHEVKALAEPRVKQWVVGQKEEPVEMKWWDGPKMMFAEVMMKLKTQAYKHPALLKLFIGVGLSIGFVLTYMNKDGILGWLQGTTTKIVAASKDAVQGVKNSVNRIRDKNLQILPNQQIGGREFVHGKAKVGGRWREVFFEDDGETDPSLVLPQMQQLLLEKIIPSMYKKTMISGSIPTFNVKKCLASCSVNGVHGVHAVVVDTQHFLVAKHFFDAFPEFMLKTGLGNFEYKIDKSYIRYVSFADIDQVLVRIFDASIVGGAKLHNKFPVDMHMLPQQQFKRINHDGESVVSATSIMIERDYGNVSDVTCTAVSCPGEPGDCGTLYLDHGGNIMGIHVAGNKTRSYFVTLSRSRLIKAMDAIAQVAPPVMIHNDAQPQMAVSAEFLDSLELPVTAVGAGPYAPINRRSNLMKVPISVDLPDLYEVADLGFKYTETEKIPVEENRLRDWSVCMHRNIQRLWNVDMEVIQTMADQVSLDNCDEPMPWHLLASGDGKVTPITRNSAAGPWLCGQSKMILCDPLEEVPKLNGFAQEILVEMDERLQDGVGMPSISAMALKVERLPAIKVAQGKTRLFQAMDAFKYMLDRRYFGPFVAELHHKLKTQTGVMYAATPEEIGAVFSTLPDTLMATDIAKQDNSHIRTAVVLIQFMLCSGAVTNEDAKYFVHPMLPLLNKDNRARYILARDSGLGQRCYFDMLIDNIGGSLASGGFLTTVFNCLISWYGIEAVMKALGRFDYVLYGDDIVSCCPDKDVMRDVFRKIGFEIKGAGPNDELIYQQKAEVVFCGRMYSEEFERMNLTDCRLAKVVRFVTLKHSVASYCSSMINFLYELSFATNYKEIVQSISYRGVYLYKYLSPEMLDAEKVRHDGFWRSKTAPEDFLTCQESLSVAVSEWMADAQVLDYVRGRLDPMSPQMNDKGKEREENAHGEVPETQAPTQETSEDMISIVTTDEKDVSSFRRSEKEVNFSFVPNEINQFWGRPVRVATISWQTTDPRSAVLGRFKGFSDIISAATNHQLKLANTVGVHGCMRVFIVVNSTPFQAGGVVVYGSPNARRAFSAIDAMTGPHSLAMAGSNQTACLDIPYNRELLWSHTQAYTTGDEATYFDWVEVSLRVLSPLNVADNAAQFVNIQVLCQLCDMEVMQGSVTGFALNPQMGPQIKKDRAAAASGATIKGVQGITETVSKVAETVAAVFSKDSHTTPAEPFTYSGAHNLANYNGTDDSKTAALNASARTIVHPQLHNDTHRDPMDVAAIAARPGVAGYFDYTTLDAPDTKLFEIWAHPLHGDGPININNVKTPATYIASHFQYWRGPMTFRFTAFKTAFHTGTIELMVDYGGNAFEPDNPSRTVNVHRTYWDLSVQVTITITIPFISPYHWKQFGNLKYSPVVYAFAVQPLVAGANVSNSIEIMVESWSPNLQVAWPQRSCRLAGEAPRPVVLAAGGGAAQLLKEKEEEEENDPVLPQMFSALSSILNTDGRKGNFDPAIVTHEMAEHIVLGVEPPEPDRDSFAYRYIAGEEVTNLRQVCKRFLNLSNESITPISNEFTYNQNIRTDFTNERVGSWPLYFETLSKIFVFGTGGYRIKVANKASGEYIEADVYMPTVQDGAELTNLSPGTPTFFQNSLSRPILELEVPNVTQFFMYRLETLNEGDQDGNRPQMATTVRYTDSTPDDEMALFFAFSDDVSWGGQNYLPRISITMPLVVFNPSTLEG